MPTPHRPYRTPEQARTGALRAARRIGAIVRGPLAAAALAVLVGGLPWALAHFIGWPLPDHLPSWDEIQVTVLAPMSPSLLLNILACLCWWIWLLFVLDVARCAIDATRGLTWPTARPVGLLRTTAAVLIGSMLLPLLSHRPAQPPTDHVTLTALTTPGITLSAAAAPGPSTSTQLPAASPSPLVPAPAGMVAVAETVRPPDHGVYDSLWRIADRIWHDGSRWPELLDTNHGIRQADGRALTNPNLIRPGWIITAFLPAKQPAPAPQPGERSPEPPGAVPPDPSAPPTTTPTTTPPATTSSTPTRSAEATPSVTETQATATPTRDRAPEQNLAHPQHAPGGIDIGTGAFVGLGLITTVLLTLGALRIWRRRRYQPGSGDRSDLAQPIAPVVRAMRTAHDQLTATGDLALPEALPIHVPQHDRQQPAPAEPVAVPAGCLTQTNRGEPDGRRIVIDLAATHGVGLLGPGAVSAARSLLVTLLAQHRGQPVRILVPEPDLNTLFTNIPDVLPRAVTLAASLDEALDDCEAELLARARHHSDHQTPLPPLVLFAGHTTHADRRLQNILDNGSTLGLAAVLIGHWRAGITIRVRAEGTVSATNSAVDQIVGARLFHLDATDTADLLSLLADADDLHTDDPAANTHHDQLGNAGPVPTASVDTGVIGEPPESDIEPNRAAPSTAGRSAGGARSVVLAPRHTSADTDLVPAPSAPSAATSMAFDHQGRIAPAGIRPAHAQAEDSGADASAMSMSDAEPGRWLLRVFGNTELVLHDAGREINLTATVTPKQREILVFLALNSVSGARRDVLNDTLWPDSPRDRPYNAMHNALSGLKRRLSNTTNARLGRLVISHDGRYRLDSTLVTTDYDQLRQAPDPQPGLHNRQIIDLYRGDLAEDITAAWIEPYREAIRRDVLDAVSVLAREHTDDPTAALALLERARSLDPYNESIYREIIRTQACLNQHDAIERTLAFLRSVLADLDQQPSDDTINLARFLQRRQPRTAGGAAAS